MGKADGSQEDDEGEQASGGLNHLVPRNAVGAQWTWKSNRCSKMTLAMLVPRTGTEFPGSQREQRDSSTNSGTTESRPDATTKRRSKLRQGTSDKHAKREAKLFQRGRQWQQVSPTGSMNVRLGFVARQATTLKAALEHRTGTRVPPDARILCWLVEFATYLLNRCDIGSEGRTPLRRLHGRRDNKPVLEFGEKREGESGNRDSILEFLW